MAYTKTTWVNSSAPPINATNLNKIEDGIEKATDIIGQESVTTTSWTATTVSVFLQKKDVSITGVTSNDFPIIAFNAESFEDAFDAGITYIESFNGGITLYADEIPASTLTFDYVITKG
jgi:hypothetical protein